MKRTYRHYTARELELVRVSDQKTDQELADMIGSTRSRIEALRRRNNIKKAPDFKQRKGREYWEQLKLNKLCN